MELCWSEDETLWPKVFEGQPLQHPFQQPFQQPTPPPPVHEWLTSIPHNDASSPDPSSPWPVSGSRADEDWKYQKECWDMSNPALDSLMGMIGLGTVKAKFVEINTLIATAQRQKVSYLKNKFGTVFIGNPGTGKSTVAKLYAEFLYAAGEIPTSKLVTTTGTRLASDGVQGSQQLLNNVQRGGVLLIDEAHQLLSPGLLSGSAALNLLLSEVENLIGKVVFVLAGHGKQMETFAGNNPAFSSLIPTTIVFPDYQDPELHCLLIHELKLKFGNKMI